MLPYASGFFRQSSMTGVERPRPAWFKPLFILDFPRPFGSQAGIGVPASSHLRGVGTMSCWQGHCGILEPSVIADAPGGELELACHAMLLGHSVHDWDGTKRYGR